MLQASQDPALLAKAPDERVIRTQAADELEGNALLELCVVAFGEVDGTHAPAANFANDAEWSHPSGRRNRRGIPRVTEHWCRGGLRRAFQETARCAVRRQE